MARAASQASQKAGRALHQVALLPCLSDNYVFLLREAGGKVAVVDPGEKGMLGKLKQELDGLGWEAPSFILNTHHHFDHTDANLELKAAFDLTIIGPAADAARIPGIDLAYGEGDEFSIGASKFRVFDTPGHTRGHISFFLDDPAGPALFPGDTLFTLGCGRLFEGTPDQMWASLSKFSELPDDTRVYGAHEYTLSNAKFAVSVEPENARLAERYREIVADRERGLPTVPSTLAKERQTNPFLRPNSADIRRNLGFGAAASDAEVFAAIRGAKDNF